MFAWVESTYCKTVSRTDEQRNVTEDTLSQLEGTPVEILYKYIEYRFFIQFT